MEIGNDYDLDLIKKIQLAKKSFVGIQEKEPLEWGYWIGAFEEWAQKYCKTLPINEGAVLTSWFTQLLKIERSKSLQLEKNIMRPQSVGLFISVVDREPKVFFQAQTVISCLVSGNVLIVINPNPEINELVSILKLENQIYFHGKVDFNSLKHPSVSGILGDFSGQINPLELEWPNKKLSIATAANDLVVILKSADLVKAINDISFSFCLGEGSWPGCAKRVFCDETIYEHFLDQLKVSIENSKNKFSKNFDLKLNFEGTALLIEPPLIKNHPHCTEWNLKPILFPVLLTSSFKYPYEAIKYGNVGNLFETVSIYGEEAAAVRLAQKVKARRICINHSATQLMPMPGIEDSCIGHFDRSAFGPFWSHQSFIHSS
jgi:hypothetical protein